MNMKNRLWLFTFAAIALATGIGAISVTAYVDPFMHFHKPYTDEYTYSLDNQRYQNDGIIRHFDYDALITGTSMTENFRTSVCDRLFDCTTIKVAYSGGSFKELNDAITRGLETHPNIKYVFRSLDRYLINTDKNYMRTDLVSEFPTYLTDDNLLNDVRYVLNRDVIYGRAWGMIDAKHEGADAGITSFDDYTNWMTSYTFGKDAVLSEKISNGTGFTISDQIQRLTEEDKKNITENVKQNVTDLADKYPNTTFYYFIPPYSAVWWGELRESGIFEKEIELEKYALSIMIPHKNIHVFGWNRFDILDDLNNYKDNIHYGEWINTWMLYQMKKESGRLIESNYEQYVDEEYRHYKDFDYASLFDQTDNEADYYISGLMNKEISGTDPVKIDSLFLKNTELKNSIISSDGYSEPGSLICKGAMQRESGSAVPVSEAAFAGDYCGSKFCFDASDYRALTFYGRKITDHGEPHVYVYDQDGKLLRSIDRHYTDIDTEWHQFALNLDGIYGDITVIFNGGYVDNTGSPNSEYEFSNIVLY